MEEFWGLSGHAAGGGEHEETTARGAKFAQDILRTGELSKQGWLELLEVTEEEPHLKEETPDGEEPTKSHGDDEKKEEDGSLVAEREKLLLEKDLACLREQKEVIGDEECDILRKLVAKYCRIWRSEYVIGLVSMLRTLLPLDLQQQTLFQVLHSFRDRFTLPRLLQYASRHEAVAATPAQIIQSISPKAQFIPPPPSPSPTPATDSSPSAVSQTFPNPPITHAFRQEVTECEHLLHSLIVYHVPWLASHLDHLGLWPCDYAALWLGTCFATCRGDRSELRKVWGKVVCSGQSSASCMLACAVVMSLSTELSCASSMADALRLVVDVDVARVRDCWDTAVQVGRSTPATFTADLNELGVGFVSLSYAPGVESEQTVQAAQRPS
eukprot:GHVS01015209.1.p1 GENE.GHVS01015209.1~~GHVS01015209.1.p1  ORF type:complete len:383 (+),score=75.04 GHVS01015209.1:36-1184(+)